MRQLHRVGAGPITMLTALLLVSTGFAAAGIDTSLDGYWRLRPSYRWVRNDTPLNPNSILYTMPADLTQSFALLQPVARYQDFRFVGQLRPFAEFAAGRSWSKLEVDEAYLEYGHQSSLFLFAGRRNLVSGVAFVANPTDFFGENQLIDRTLSESERRELRNGVYLAGMQRFFDDANLSAVVAPRISSVQQQQSDRALIRFDRVFPKQNADLGLLALFGNDRPGGGLNLSYTAGEALVLYTESAVRRGRDRPTVNGGINGLVLTPPSRSGWYLNAVVGGQYTFSNAVNLILEYQHDANGYDAAEWLMIQDYLLVNGVAAALPGGGVSQALGNLAQANQNMGGLDLRRNYLFARVSHPRWWLKTDTSLFILKNLDDGSELVRARSERAVTDKLVLGVMAERMAGARRSEFGMRPWEWAVVIDIKYFF